MQKPYITGTPPYNYILFQSQISKPRKYEWRRPSFNTQERNERWHIEQLCRRDSIGRHWGDGCRFLFTCCNKVISKMLALLWNIIRTEKCSYSQKPVDSDLRFSSRTAVMSKKQQSYSLQAIIPSPWPKNFQECKYRKIDRWHQKSIIIYQCDNFASPLARLSATLYLRLHSLALIRN